MKKGLVVLLVLVVFCMSSVMAASYSDVSGHWAEGAIERWTDEEIINGYGDNSYKPEGYITRAEFINMLVKMFEPSEMANLDAYYDLDANAWYYDAFAKAVSMGIINGYDDGSMQPNAPITRQEAMTILNRAINLNAEGKGSIGKYTDASDIADWAKEAIEVFTENGFLNGYEDGSFHPNGLITRAESATVLDNTIGMVITKSGTYDLEDVKGVVIVKAEDVEIKNATGVNAICVKDAECKETLKADETATELVENAAVVGEKVEDNSSNNENNQNSDEDNKGGSNGGGGGSSSSTTKTVTITLTTDGDVYSISRDGTAKLNTKLVVKVDEKEVCNSVVKTESELATAMKKVIDEVNVETLINTLDANYNTNQSVRDWGMNTILELDEKYVTVAFRAALPEDGVKASVKEVYGALVNAGLTDSELKTAAKATLENTFDANSGLSLLNQI